MKEIKQNSLRAWVLAARPKTLTAALIPVLLGSALAFSDGCFQEIPALLCAFFACFMQIAANFINDLFDFRKGSDREDRLGPERACAQGWITPSAMKTGIGLTLLIASLTGLSLLFYLWGKLPHGGWELILLGVLCILVVYHLYLFYFSMVSVNMFFVYVALILSAMFWSADVNGRCPYCHTVKGLKFLGRGDLKRVVTVDEYDDSRLLSRKVATVLQDADSQIVNSIVEDELAFGLEK